MLMLLTVIKLRRSWSKNSTVLDLVTMDESVIKRSAKIRNHASLLDIVIVDKKQVQIDPMVLF